MKPKPQKSIYIKGARENNLKNIDITIPRDKFIVITGLSGSGKSSLAFNTIYAEGQRRYVESLSSYARQFIGIMEKPDLDYIEGLILYTLVRISGINRKSSFLNSCQTFSSNSGISLLQTLHQDPVN